MNTLLQLKECICSSLVHYLHPFPISSVSLKYKRSWILILLYTSLLLQYLILPSIMNTLFSSILYLLNLLSFSSSLIFDIICPPPPIYGCNYYYPPSDYSMIAASSAVIVVVTSTSSPSSFISLVIMVTVPSGLWINYY